MAVSTSSQIQTYAAEGGGESTAWVLTSGVWEDTGEWIDTDNWID